MAKSRRKHGHVRLTCPHCGRNVSVQRPQRFQPAMPCPNCRVPINATLILAAEAALHAPEAGPEGAANEPGGAEAEERGAGEADG
ncbi:MAG: hypothetical protein M5U01_25830 [Ardenticatenaceae bacterium]|nr:hypothetical protein [Ardenticatenaceae bacterium]HBY96712.1 hypothetical protein [Chloroflexota bacterium]